MRVAPLLAACALLAPPAFAADTAPLVLRGGAIYTLDTKRPWASAVVVESGRIVYVGDDEGTRSHENRGARVIELRGRMVLPGFHDAHVHPMSGGMRLLRCQLGGLDEVRVYAAVRACAAAAREGEWVLGSGWTLDSFAGGEPARAKLDELIPDRPAFLTTEDGFRAWVNSKALQSAGLDRAGGVVEGELAGRIRRVIPAPTQAQYREALRRATAMANRLGITSIYDASANDALIAAYRAADAAGELTVRVVAAQRVDPQRGLEQVAGMVARRESAQGRRFRADGAKLFLDGEIDHHTAALVAPYADQPTSSGRLFFEPLALRTLVAELESRGFSLHMHAMGDAAVRAGLDAIAAARKANGNLDRRHQIAHLGVVHPDDLPRFELLGVAASITAIWADARDPSLPGMRRALGEARSRWILPFGSLARAGARLTAGSDWPSPSMNPLDGIRAALTHHTPRERLGLPAILAAYTRDGAWAMRAEGSVGSIELGKAADLVVLERNLFDLDPARLAQVRVLLTLLDGQPVYRAPDFDWPGLMR